ncbi:MAG: Ribonuclease P protein component [Elusimicrobia bacterium ADurb.Bin231]|nr:MAG: Ribonuclease P protein component [Elusimicrobia bacterium ADurb.Bin231]
MGLASVNRLTGKTDFSLIRKTGRKIFCGYITLYVLENGKRFSRLAVVIPAKVAHSARRHRIKRLFREAFRRNLCFFNRQVDVIILPAKEIASLNNYAMAESVLISGLKKTGIINAQKNIDSADKSV